MSLVQVCGEINSNVKVEGRLNMLEGWRAAITVGTNNSPLTGLSNRY